MPVSSKNPASKFLKRKPSHQFVTSATPSDTPNDVPASPASTTEVPSLPTHTPSLLSPVSLHDPDHPASLQEESDNGANSSESEYLLSDPTGYRTRLDQSPDKKVQFTVSKDGDDPTETEDKDNEGRKDKKKRR